ncbi:MAG TPA: hypothetical protein VMW72_07685 [Sedimentisphaerales bacterium]|nr:hypothetical protein [Sedimentisphaerales bacterium]
MIREMTDTDIDKAINIWKDAMPLAHKNIPQEYWDTLLPNILDELKNADEKYVYVEDKMIVGFIDTGR